MPVTCYIGVILCTMRGSAGVTILCIIVQVADMHD